jgi:hypothetical protein
MIAILPLTVDGARCMTERQDGASETRDRTIERDAKATDRRAAQVISTANST